MKISRKPTRAEVPSMAMGDIAFNLIVFFVILARVQDDSHLKWTPARVADVEGGKLSQVSVVIDEKHQLYLNGNEANTANLAALIKKHLEGLEGIDRVVQFKVHKSAPQGLMAEVTEAIGEAGADAFLIVDRE